MEGKPLALVVLLAGALAIGTGVLVLHAASAPPPAPERPHPPPSGAALAGSEMRFSPMYYRTLVQQDAKAYGVQAPTLDDFAQPNPYFEEIKSPQRLRVKAPVETRHLKLSLEIQKAMVAVEGQSMNADHLVLRIENLTDSYLAYRIQTNVSDKRRCITKAVIPHNAIALEPKQTILRSECLYRRDEAVELGRVEVIELPALSAHYVSRLPPNPTLYDTRTFIGHQPIGGETCPQTFSWRDIQEGVDRKELGWRDVIDFYARHNCNEYSFFKSYRYRSDASAPLPARPLD